MICYWHFRRATDLALESYWPGPRAASLERSTRVNNEVPRSLTLADPHRALSAVIFTQFTLTPRTLTWPWIWAWVSMAPAPAQAQAQVHSRGEREPRPASTIDFNLFNLCINFCACLCSIFLGSPMPLCINYWHLSPLKMKVIQLSALTLKSASETRLPGSRQSRHVFPSDMPWMWTVDLAIGYFLLWRPMDINRWQFSCNCLMLFVPSNNWQAISVQLSFISMGWGRTIKKKLGYIWVIYIKLKSLNFKN